MKIFVSLSVARVGLSGVGDSVLWQCGSDNNTRRVVTGRPISTMKLLRQTILVVALAVVAQGKPHESSKSHSVKHSREHELTNRMGHGDHHRRNHGSSGSLSSSHKEGSTTQRAPHDKIKDQHSSHSHETTSSGHHEMEKEQHQHQHHITEHNIHIKKDDDKDPSVLMVSEHLIHVTPRPVKTHHTKGNHHKNKANDQTTEKLINKGGPLSTRKIQKTPKKYSAKKHGWKKSSRKDKTTKERLREKYERHERRSKALHHAVAGKDN